MQPAPVMRPMSALPLRMAKACSASATTSMAPVMATTALVFAAKARANAALAAKLPSVTASSGHTSTPRVEAAPPASAFTSDMLPRMTDTSSRSSKSPAVFVRSADAPTPTGSSTMGCPSSPARSPAANMPAMERSSSVPMLSVSPPQMVWISRTSAGSWLMMGLAPMASSAFAQSFTVT